MVHVCEGLLEEEICEDGEIWAPCEADICDDPCRLVGICKCSCHKED